MMKVLGVSLICFAIVFAACDARETVVNGKEDIDGAKIVAEEFLTARKGHELEKAMELTLIDKKNIEYNRHLENLQKVETTLGGIISYALDSARSNIVKEGFERTGEIKLSYTVKYNQGTANEEYYLAYRDDKIKIMQYLIKVK